MSVVDHTRDPDRADRIAALRRLADLLEQCPDLPCPDDAFISLRDSDDVTAVRQLQAAERQLAARGIRVRRESPLSTRRQHAISFDLDGFTYDAFRTFRDSRIVDSPKAAA